MEHMFRYVLQNGCYYLCTTIRSLCSTSTRAFVDEILIQFREVSHGRSRADLETLGRRLFPCIHLLTPVEAAEVTQYFTQAKYVRKEWIQLLASHFRPKEVTLSTNMSFLISLGALQRLYNKQTAPKNTLFAIDYLPSFTQLHHSPLLPNHSGLFHKIIQPMMARQDLSGRAVVSLVYALSQLAPKDESFRNITEDLVINYSKANNFDLQSSAILLYSFSRFQIQNELLVQPLVQNLLKRSHLDEGFPFEMISMVFYSLGKLQFAHKNLTEELIVQAQKPEIISRFSCWDLSSLFYGISHLHLQDVNSMKLFSLGKEACRSQRKSTFSEQGLSLVLYSLGQLRFNNNAILRSLLEEVLKPLRIAEVTYQGLCMIIHGLQKLPRNQQRAVQEQYSTLVHLLADAIRLKTDNLEKFNSKEKVSFMFGAMLARSCLESWDIDKILKCLDQQTNGFEASFLAELSRKELLILLKALSKLDMSSTTAWSSILHHILLMENADLIKEPGILTNMLYASTSNHFSGPPSIASSFNKQIIETLEKCDLSELLDSDLVQLVQSVLSEQEFGNNEFLNRLLQETTKDSRLGRFAYHHFVNLLATLAQIPSVDDNATLQRPMHILKSRILLKKVDESGLITLFYYFSKWKASDSFTQKLREELMSRSESFALMDGQYISMTVQSLANTGISDPKLVAPVLQELMVVQNFNNFSEKSLILILHSLLRLEIRNIKLLVSICQEFIKRDSLETMKLDLLSTFLYTLGRFQYNHKEVFDRSFNRLLMEEFSNLDSVGWANILDAMGRLGIQDERITQYIMEGLNELDLSSPFNSRTCSSILHSVGRLKLKDSNTTHYTRRVLESFRIDRLNPYGVSGLLFAMVEIGLTNFQYTRIITKTMMTNQCLEKYRVGHLGNLICRFPLLEPDQSAIPFIYALLNTIEKKVVSQELSVDNLGQFIMGIGRLSQKYNLVRNPFVFHTLALLEKSEILDKMSISDLVGNISAASHFPNTGLSLAQATAKYLLRDHTLAYCTDRELLVLFNCLPKFYPYLHDLSIAVSRLMNRNPGLQLMMKK